MNIFFGNLFWGLLLVLWGVSLILKTFNVNMPLAKIFIAIVIILFGIKLLVGDRAKFFKSGTHTSKGASYIRSNSTGEYTFVFSGGTIDLTDMDSEAKDMEITVVFGSADVYLPKDLNFDIQPTSVFGSTILPNKSHVGIGEMSYQSGSGSGRPIRIESTSVFGRIQYIFKERKTSGVADPIIVEEAPTDF